MLAGYLCFREGVRPDTLQGGGRGRRLGLKAAASSVLARQVKDVECDLHRVDCLFLLMDTGSGAYC